MNEHRRNVGTAILVVLAAFAAWEGASRAGWINTALVPAPTQVARALAAIVVSGQLWAPAAETLKLILVSFAIATFIGVSLGVMMGISRTAYNLLEPLVELLRPIPKPALIPPLFLFFGIGWTSMVIIVTVAAVFPVLTNTISGVRGIDPVLLDTARTFRTVHTVRRVVLPAALPSIFTGMKVSIGIAVVLVAIAEVLAGQSGVGTRLVEEQRAFIADRMYAWVIVLSALGVLLVVLLQRLESIVVPWRGKE